jgi:hypothetical protein
MQSAIFGKPFQEPSQTVIFFQDCKKDKGSGLNI